MKKSIIVCSLIGILLASCTKETTKLKLTLEPINTHSKVVLHDGYRPRWNSGDEIRVNATTCEVNGDVTVAPTAESYTAVYPADAVTGNIFGVGTLTVSIPERQPYAVDNQGYQIVKAPMVAYSTGSTLNFKNVCAVMGISVRNNTGENLVVKSIEVYASEHALSGTGVVTGVQSNPVLNVGSGKSYGVALPSRYVTLTGINTNVTAGTTSRIFYLYMLPTSDEDNQFTITVYAISVSTGRSYSFSRKQTSYGTDLESGVVTAATLTATTENRTTLPCFSVSDNKKVLFSKSNLVGRYSSGNYNNRYWNFRTNQYYTLGNNNDFEDDGGDMDLLDWRSFGWSLNGYHGVVAAREWRLLTCDEWNYLLNSRPSASSLRGPARITVGANHYNGYLLLPDGWVCPAGITFNSSATFYDSQNNYTSSQWSDMQAAGAIFLPAAGSWWPGDAEVFSPSTGIYWTASEGTGSNSHYVLDFSPQAGYFSVQLSSSLNAQYNSVRLVRDL